MSKQQTRVGVIGVGMAGVSHIAALRIEGFDVAVVSATSQERADGVAQQTGVGRAVADHRAILDDPTVDAVVVATPTAHHHQIVLDALAAGKHVIVEKPIGLDLEQARSARDAAAASGLTAMIAQAFRFSPTRRHVKQLLDDGYVGDVRQVIGAFHAGPTSAPVIDPSAPRKGPGEMHWRMTRATGGGVLDGAGSTFFDSLRDWVGELSGVSGRTVEYGPERQWYDGSIATAADADEGFVSLFQFANGAVGTMTMSFASPYGFGGRIEIFGSEGSLQIVQPDLLPGPNTVVSGGRFSDGPGLTELITPPQFLIPPDERDPQPPFMTAYRPLAQAFAHGIATGTSPSPNFDDAYRDQEITDAILTSSVDGAWVPLGQ